MQRTNAELKEQAKESLRGHWKTTILSLLALFGIAIIAAILITIVFTLFGIEESQSSLMAFLMSIPVSLLAVGLFSYYFRLSCCQGDGARVGNLFYIFHNHPLKFIGNVLLNSGAIWLGSIVYAQFMIRLIWPVTGFENYELYQTLCSVFLLVYYVYVVYIWLTFSQTTYLLIDFPDLTVLQAYKRSYRLMKGRRIKLLKLYASFILWLLLGMVTMGIGLLYIAPYMGCTSLEFYLDLLGSQD